MQNISPHEVSAPPYVIPNYVTLDQLFPYTKALLESANVYISQCGSIDSLGEQILTSYENDLDMKTIKLAKNSDLNTCQDAVNMLIFHFETIMPSKRAQFVEYWKRWHFLESQLKAHEEVLSCQDDNPVRKEYLHKVQLQLDRSDEVVDNLDTWFERAQRSSLESIQVRIHSLLEEQSEKIKKTLLVDRNRFSAHLNRKKEVLKPTVELSRDNRVDMKLPLEISSIIFSYCDLETCYTLRQVSSFWYNLYQDYDFEPKLTARCPWFTPGDDIHTWTDCALVFAARLKTYQPVEGDITLSDELVDTKIFVGRQLPYEEKLPKKFDGLQGHYPQCQGYCEMYHTDAWVKDLKSYQVLDDTENYVDVTEAEHVTERENHVTEEPTFLYPESEPEDEFKPDLEGDKDRLIKFSNTIITLPPQCKGPLNCWSKKNALFVLARQRKAYVFQRDKPHYKDAVCVKSAFFHEINKVVVWEKANQYSLCDFSHKKLVEYPEQPVASYNGLIWTCPTKGTLVASFMDLENGKRYYSPKKSIEFSTNFYEDSMGSFRQCSKYPQFCVAKFIQGLILVDLKERTVTHLINPLCCNDPDVEEDELHVFPGYLNGKFDVRYTDPMDDGDFNGDYERYSDEEESGPYYDYF